jgi:mono/diheme cytochrome c family protein
VKASLLALSTTQAILFTLAGVLLLAAGVGALLYSRRRPPEMPDIPPSMQPGPSDADLEKPNLEKLQGWGVMCFIFLAVYIPLIWFQEPNVNVLEEQELLTSAIERGERAVELFSEENPGGVGCVQCHGPGLAGGRILFQGEPYTVPNLTTVCGGPAYGHTLITSLDDVRNTIREGRAGTPMPSWSIRFAGSMNDQQIEDIVQYILSIQTVPFEDNVCVNPSALDTASPEATPTGSETP